MSWTYALQSTKTKALWIEYIHQDSDNKVTRARMHLRSRGGGTPTASAVEAFLAKKGDAKVTREAVVTALRSGEEVSCFLQPICRPVI